jgi:hypothetical protein
MLPGCQRSSPSAAEEMANKAQAAVERALDAWTRGQSLAEFTASEPSMRLDEPDWKTGHRLLSFLTSDAKTVGEQPGLVQCRVALSLQDAKGHKTDKNVAYKVQLGEPLKVTRTAGAGS